MKWSLKEITATKAALVTLFKISCPICQLTLPFLERMAKTDNFEMIGISQDDAEATQQFRERYGLTFTTLLDEDHAGYPVSNAFGITHVPSMFLVEPDGQISMAVSGFSKKDIEAVGKLAGIDPFHPGEKVPDWKPG
jgi:peroxiredoxin